VICKPWCKLCKAPVLRLREALVSRGVAAAAVAQMVPAQATFFAIWSLSSSNMGYLQRGLRLAPAVGEIPSTCAAAGAAAGLYCVMTVITYIASDGYPMRSEICSAACGYGTVCMTSSLRGSLHNKTCGLLHDFLGL
jgi:hypothetical protein